MHQMVEQLKRSNWISLGVVGAAAISIAGCAVGPNYKEPKVDVPAEYRPPTTRATTQTVAEAISVRWWESFNDPLLSALIADTANSNLDLRAAEARVRQSRYLTKVASAGYWPTANATGSYSRVKNGGGSSISTVGGVPVSVSGGGKEHDLWQAGFDASWELDVFGGVRRSVEAATADFQAQQASLENVLVSLYGEVATNYVSLRGIQREIAISEENARAQRETLELTRTRYRAGLTSDLDVARAEAQVANTEATIPALRTQLSAAIHRVGVLTGKEPTALLDELSLAGQLPPPPPVIPIGVPAELLRRRPDIRFAERTLAAETARIGIFTADLYPRFALNGDLAWRAANAGSLFNNSNLGWSLGPGFTWNIFSAGRTRANIGAQREAADAALANYQQTVLLAMEEVQNALVAYQEDQARMSYLRQSVSSNQRAVYLSEQLYQRGLADFLNVLQAQLALFLAEDQLVRTETNLSTDVVALYKALGGGWEQAPAQPTTRPTAPPMQPLPSGQPPMMREPGTATRPAAPVPPAPGAAAPAPSPLAPPATVPPATPAAVPTSVPPPATIPPASPPAAPASQPAR